MKITKEKLREAFRLLEEDAKQYTEEELLEFKKRQHAREQQPTDKPPAGSEPEEESAIQRLREFFDAFEEEIGRDTDAAYARFKAYSAIRDAEDRAPTPNEPSADN